MEIRDLAERVLFGDNLQDKLAPASVLTDETPGASISVPESPVRPSMLQIKKGGEMAHFPRIHELEQNEPRARLLHFFANHELLATELMALVLLRFPEAPKAFRRGVAKTLMEEQVHTQLYLDRMGDLGFEFGSYPVTGFFWETLKDMKSPLDYVTGLPLTFEQANLDFARHFGGVFEQIGDEKCKALMDRIYRDEIRHVAYGLKWFRTWKNPEVSDWEAYKEHLRLPLSPRRAKGSPYNIEGRQRSGFDGDFIQSLAVYSKSKGRCPNIFYFNPTAEWEMARGNSFTPTRHQKELQRDLENLPQFFGGEDDVVLVSTAPKTDWLVELNQAGIPIPEYEVLSDGKIAATSELLDRKLGRLRPWAWSLSSCDIFRPLVAGASSSQSHFLSNIFNKEDDQLNAMYSKESGCQLLQEVLADGQDSEWLCSKEDVGVVVTDAGAAIEAIESWRSRGRQRFVAKANYGAAGNRMMRLWEPEITDAQMRWMEKVVKQKEALVVEPWHERILDFSAHYEMDKEGVRFSGFVRMLNDHRGQFFASTVAAHLTSGLGSDLPRFLHGKEGNRHKRLYEQIGCRLQEKCQRVGYLGPLGVDAYVYRDHAEQWRLKPVVEVNPRFTMGRLALSLRRYAAPGRVVTLVLLSSVQLRQLNLGSFSEIPSFLHHRFPIQMSGVGLKRISEGALCLNDHSSATQCVAVFFVGQDAFDWVESVITI
ncbi:MAG: DUF455 family protein [Verrucomicrobia bacterium]|nr:DUF455 family protein [Verrucomicrobiota bacterium]